MNESTPELDSSALISSPYARRVEKPWGWELHWTRPGLPYVGKVLRINAGKRLSLQVHDAKIESWLLVSGRAKVIWDGPDGRLQERELEPRRGYDCQTGRRHRLAAITDCEIIEVSTPEIGTTWRLDDDFARPHETPAQRALERDE